MVEHTMVFLAIALSIVTLIVMHERRQRRGLLSLLNRQRKRGPYDESVWSQESTHKSGHHHDDKPASGRMPHSYR